MHGAPRRRLLDTGGLLREYVRGHVRHGRLALPDTAGSTNGGTRCAFNIKSLRLISSVTASHSLVTRRAPSVLLCRSATGAEGS